MWWTRALNLIKLGSRIDAEALQIKGLINSTTEK